MAKPNATEDELIRVTQLAKLDTVLSSAPWIWHEKLGSAGSRLSGGERQRLVLARMLLKCPSIMILDETTSELDSITETELLKAIAKEYEGLTLIFISHRVRAMQWVDRIIVLEKGTVADDASHPVLLRRSALYRQLSMEEPLTVVGV
jgi:ABC-type transport system involved in cytochrome bd biosynthesis fused ATPase/permease subunit